MRKHLPVLTLSVILTAALAAFPAPAEKRVLRVDDLFRLAAVDDPQISPDGKLVAFTVTTLDAKKDESETALWMVATGGGEPWRLTARGDSAERPRWSPDGRRLGFLAERKVDEDEDEEAKAQVWAFDLRGGDAQRLTQVPQGVVAFDFSPDGRRLLLTIRDPKPEDLLKPAERKEKEKKPDPHVIDRRQFKMDGVGYLDRRRTHLYVFDLESETLRQITSGDFDDAGAAWSPDGKLVAFSSKRTGDPDSNDNHDVWIVSADGDALASSQLDADKGQTLRQLTTNPGPDTQPQWSPDGELVAYLAAVEPDLFWYATPHLAVVPAAGGEPRLLTAEVDRHVYFPRFASDGTIYFVLEDSGAFHLAAIDVDGGAVRRLVAGERSVYGLSVSRGGVAVLMSEPQFPFEVFLLEGGGPRQLTHANRELLAEVRLGKVEEVRFKSADGTEIEGFLTFPPDFNELLTYPALLRIHGGPVGQYDFAFDFPSQLFAANGYLVIRPNPRGSSGQGQAFSAAIFADWGNKDYEDVMAAVDDAIARGYADPERLGVGGWSYGGILTNYVITKTDRFKGAVTGASEVLYAANYGHDHYQLEWELELGLPWENRELWERLSPFNRVEKITTPTLVMCGAQDWDVPVLNSEQLYQSLKRLGRTTELVVYPGEDHGIDRPSFRKDRLQRYLDWYGRYVKGETTRGDGP